MKVASSKPAMRRLPARPEVNRRGFLGGSGLAAIGVTVIPVTALTMAPAEVYAQTFNLLGADVGKALIRIARDVFPHDKLSDKYYAAAVAPYEDASSKDPKVKSMLTEGVAALDASATSAHGHTWTPPVCKALSRCRRAGEDCRHTSGLQTRKALRP